MKILLFQGKSNFSRLIRAQTCSRYSHAAIQLRDGSIVEAWHTHGVQHVDSISTLHTTGTRVDFYRIAAIFNQDAAAEWLLSQVGKNNQRYSGTELALVGVSRGGLDLLHGVPKRMTPRDLALSPFLYREHSELTK